jgi:soluble lytic murein transglycosylase-like protein
MRFCFLIFVFGLVLFPAGALMASDTRSAAETAAPVSKISTVRVDRSSGRLVRSIVVQPKVVAPVVVKPGAPASEPAPPKLAADAALNEIIEHSAKKHDVDPLLVHSVIQVESGYNKYALSPKGAQGLMQLIPSTARRLGVKNVWDPQENIEAGVRYLKMLQSQFRDDRLALAAYNAGEGAVSRYGWIPPYAETQNYVYQVGKRYGEAKRAVERSKPAPKPEPSGPRPIEHFVDSEGRLHLRNR